MPSMDAVGYYLLENYVLQVLQAWGGQVCCCAPVIRKGVCPECARFAQAHQCSWCVQSCASGLSDKNVLVAKRMHMHLLS